MHCSITVLFNFSELPFVSLFLYYIKMHGNTVRQIKTQNKKTILVQSVCAYLYFIFEDLVPILSKS